MLLPRLGYKRLQFYFDCAHSLSLSSVTHSEGYLLWTSTLERTMWQRNKACQWLWMSLLIHEQSNFQINLQLTAWLLLPGSSWVRNTQLSHSCILDPTKKWDNKYLLLKATVHPYKNADNRCRFYYHETGCCLKYEWLWDKAVSGGWKNFKRGSSSKVAKTVRCVTDWATLVPQEVVFINKTEFTTKSIFIFCMSSQNKWI